MSFWHFESFTFVGLSKILRAECEKLFEAVFRKSIDLGLI